MLFCGVNGSLQYVMTSMLANGANQSGMDYVFTVPWKGLCSEPTISLSSFELNKLNEEQRSPVKHCCLLEITLIANCMLLVASSQNSYTLRNLK